MTHLKYSIKLILTLSWQMNSFYVMNSIWNRNVQKQLIVISESYNKQALILLWNASGTSINGIPIQFWVQVSESITKPLSKLFNYYINKNKLPNDWNIWYISIVYPLFKEKGSKPSTNSYRPISILNSLKKYLMRLCMLLLKTINSKISNNQFGFNKKSLTLSNLLYTYSHVYSNIEKKHKAVVIITIDYNKAFDKVNHTILTRKLENLVVLFQTLL